MVSFDTEFPTVAENIRNCVRLTDIQKKNFFTEIDGASHGTREKMKEDAEIYFYAKKFLGEQFRDRDDLTRLGNLHGWSALRNDGRAKKIFRDTPYGIEGYQDAVKTGDWSKLGEMLEYLEDIPLGYVIWGFRGEDNAPFVGIDLADLPCRLALGSVDPDAYFPVEIKVPEDAEVREATAFDAGIFDLWCPGGWTCPRSECQDKPGLREAVIPGAYMPGGWVTFGHTFPPEF